MRLFKVLLKKCFRDLVRNFKQFVSIIFIIAISVTLFIGLEANAVSFEGRVHSVYRQGNLSDLWVTVAPNFEDETEVSSDMKFIEEVGGENSEVETRLFLPSAVLTYNVTGLISTKFPKINTAYDVETINYDNSNYFFVDKALITKYEEFTGNSFKLGDSLPVTFQTVMIKSMLGAFAGNEVILKDLLTKAINASDLNPSTKEFIIKLINENISVIQEALIGVLNTALSKDTISISIPVNGVMSHPENIENGQFSSSSYLLSSRALLSYFIETLGNNLSSKNILNELKIGRDEASDENLIKLLDAIISELEKPETQIVLDSFILFQIKEYAESIRKGTNENLEVLLDNFYNQYCIKLGDNVNINEVKDKITKYYQDKEKNNLVAIQDRGLMASIATVENDIVQSKQLTYVFPVIFFVVAILIVLTTITQLILKERTQIGTLKGLGVKKHTILNYYLIFMNVIGLIGTLFGFIIGPLLIPNILNIKYDIIYSLPSLTFTFPWIQSLVVLLIVIILISALTYLIIRKELNKPTSESIRQQAPRINIKHGKVNFKNTSIMMALRNIKVHMTKSIMVIIGVMGCTALLICGMGIDDTLNYGKNLDLDCFMNSDISITLNVGTKRGTAETKLKDIEGIEDIEEYSLDFKTVYHDNDSINTSIYYIKEKSNFFKFDDDMFEGHWDRSGVAITEQKAKKLGVKVGDELTFDVNGTLETYKITSIFYAFSQNGVFIYDKTIPDYTNVSSRAWIDVKDGYDNKEVKERLLKETDVVYTATTYEENSDMIDGYMSSVGQMTTTVKVFAIMLAVVVLINLAILNFNERLRDIATLKVLGFSRAEISRSLIYEVMILTLLGATLGLFFGLPMEMIVLGVNEVELISWKYVIFPVTYVISFLISFLTAFIVNMLITTKINKVSMSESLKSVE